MKTKIDELPAGFEEFWKVYPRRVEKQAAIRMYNRAIKKTTPATILTVARRYANERAGKEMSFIKHPATWLNSERWEDYQPMASEAPTAAEAPTGFYANFTSRELEAWEEYGKATRGRGYPRDKNGGWYFPTRWPPNVQETAA